MKILLTGAEGFIARNLATHLAERDDVEVLSFTRASSDADLAQACAAADFVFHLAGVNRPQAASEYDTGNWGLTKRLCDALTTVRGGVPILLSSSAQASMDNPYGASKRKAERELLEYHARTRAPVHIFRLPNVFGKWCRPNYNSAVATFCHNTARELPIHVNDRDAPLSLVYIDDVVARFIQVMDGHAARTCFCDVEPVYRTTVGTVADLIRAFRDSRHTLVTEAVGTGLTRALYSTYVSYLPPSSFAYGVAAHEDPRGVFVEFLKTRDSGQFSCFTVRPATRRGGHYHHSKTEKFLVLRGSARFGFRHIVTNEVHEIFSSGTSPMIVETAPGWTHDITNVGEEEMVVMLWANELFDPTKPDTVISKV